MSWHRLSTICWRFIRHHPLFLPPFFYDTPSIVLLTPEVSPLPLISFILSALSALHLASAVFPAFEEEEEENIRPWLGNFLTRYGFVDLGSSWFPIRTTFRVFPAAGRKVAVQLGADRQHHEISGGWVCFSFLKGLYDYDTRSGNSSQHIFDTSTSTVNTLFQQSIRYLA